MSRLFRADTPHDVACAAIVAASLPPGRNVVAFLADKAETSLERLRACLEAMALTYRWDAVVDLTGVFPLGSAWRGGLWRRWRRVRSQVKGVQAARRRLAPAFGLDPSVPSLAIDLSGQVDELYLTCLHHPDVRMMAVIAPKARISYFPHGFDSLHSAEAAYYAPFAYVRGGADNEATPLLSDWWKRALLGQDAVPVRRVGVETAFSFTRPAPWAASNVDLSHVLTPDTMQNLFLRLPEQVRAYFRAKAEECPRDVGLLLLTPSYMGDTYPYALEIEGFLRLAEALEQGGAQYLVAKPHPLTTEQHTERTLAALHAAGLRSKIVVLQEHREYPVEIISTPFALAGCGGIGTSSLRTLRTLYGIQAFCPEQLLYRLYEGNSSKLRAVNLWIEDHRGQYTPI